MTEVLYRGWERAEIDRQLNLRARWPEHADYFARWARDSAAVRAELECHLDLPYGESPGQRLDIFPAATANGTPAPLVAFIHGGYWQSLSKGDFSYLAPPFIAAGIAFASIDYDLAPTVSVPEIVDQTQRALAWLARAGEGYGIDPTRITVVGHSAGGHLAVMALAADWAARAPDLPGGPVRGACSISGVYDLTPIRMSYQQEVLRLSPAAVEAASPTRCIPSRAGPLICAVGSVETEEFQRQQAEFVAAWRAAGLRAGTVDLPGCHHFSAVDALRAPDHALFQAVRTMAAGAPGP